MTRRCLILCQNPVLTSHLQLWLARAGCVAEELIETKVVGSGPGSRGIARVFGELADWIESNAGAGSVRNGVPEVICLTDLCGYGVNHPAHLNPLKSHGWATVLGMLVLAFPEIHWVFCSGTLSEAWAANPSDYLAFTGVHVAKTADELNEVFATIQNDLPPLFDGTGLRNSIHVAIDADRGHEQLPRRNDLAVAIDEERSYAWLHAYTSYRFGFRAQAVTTYAGMQRVTGDRNIKSPGYQADENTPDSQLTLVFEDYFLQFSDGNPAGFSHLRRRDNVFGFQRLQSVKYRILVTSGHHRGQDIKARVDNPLYLRELRADKEQWNCEISKPLGGIFNLWKDSKLQRKLRDGGRRGLAHGFNWPRPFIEAEGEHSTPGRLLVIADRLIARSESLLSEVKSVPMAVYGALLSTDAIELLGGKTPTTSLEALMLKHQFEVLAECQFVGTQQHMDVDSRMKDIRREVESLSGWFGAKRRQRVGAAWNAELSILNKLIEIFRNYNQFDEEQAIHVRARALHRKLRFRSYPVLIKPVEILPWYVEKLVASFPLFITALVLWILFLGGLYAWAGEVPWDRGLADAYTTFIGIGPPGDEKLWTSSSGWNVMFWLIAITIGFGFLHLGIFISHLYSLISRK